MIKIKEILLVSISAFLLAAMPVLARAQGDGSSPAWHSGQRIEQVYKQLNLTDTQKKQLEANKLQHRSKMQSLHQEVKADKEALKDELMKPGLDMAKINGLHRKIKAVMSQMEDIKLNSILEVRTILTPQQFSKFINLMHEHHEGHGDR